jgi:hypothetical protein
MLTPAYLSRQLDMAAPMADFHLVVYAGPTRTGAMIYEELHIADKRAASHRGNLPPAMAPTPVLEFD